MKNNNF